VYVGSANLDQRSLFINYELLVRLPNRQLAEGAEEIFRAALANSARIDAATWPTSRGLWTRLKERCAFWLLARVDPYVAQRQLDRLRTFR